MIDYLYSGKKLPKSNEKWSREPLSRKDFDELNKIQIDMDSSEIKRRIRATLYKKFRPKLSFNNFNFELNED